MVDPAKKNSLYSIEEYFSIECFSRELSSEGWHYQVYEKLEDVILLDQLDSQLSLFEIYEDIKLIEG